MAAALFFSAAGLSVISAFAGTGAVYLKLMLAVTFLGLGSVFASLSMMMNATAQLQRAIVRAEENYHRWAPNAMLVSNPKPPAKEPVKTDAPRPARKPLKVHAAEWLHTLSGPSTAPSKVIDPPEVTQPDETEGRKLERRH